MTYPERPVFGENGVVLKRTTQPPVSVDDQPEKHDRLRRKEPKPYWLFLTWLLAGPLNPLALFLITIIAFGEQYLFREMQAVLWLVSIPSALAATSGLANLHNHSATNVGILWLTVKMMLITAGIATVFFGTIVLAVAPLALVFVIGFALMVGVPAALSAAIVVRLTLFKWRPLEDK